MPLSSCTPQQFNHRNSFDIIIIVIAVIFAVAIWKPFSVQFYIFDDRFRLSGRIDCLVAFDGSRTWALLFKSSFPGSSSLDTEPLLRSSSHRPWLQLSVFPCHICLLESAEHPLLPWLFLSSRNKRGNITYRLWWNIDYILSIVLHVMDNNVYNYGRITLWVATEENSYRFDLE